MGRPTVCAPPTSRGLRQLNDAAGHYEIEEPVGGWQAADGGYWMGKTFYNGEGTTGVGGLAFVNQRGQYTFMQLPELEPWPVRTLLVEPEAIWAGLVNYPEGAPVPGGLLRYDRATKTATIIRVPGVIRRLVRMEGTLFARTIEGLAVLRADGVTWYHMEPDVTGRLRLHVTVHADGVPP